jgi:ABC-type glycerol-3-phosphate transport system permease component
VALHEEYVRERTLFAALPTLVVYIFLGRSFLRGLMAGAING